jgi:hypothetical protein
MDTQTAEVDSPQTEEEAVADASLNDLREALGHPGLETPEPGTEAPETPVEPQQPEVEGQQPEAPVAEAAPLAKRRIRPRTELDQQVIDLYRSDAFNGSFADATKVIFSQTDAPTTSQPQAIEAPQPDPFEGHDAQVGDLQTQIQELEEKVATASEELETTEALKLQREIMRKELELQTLHSRKERAEEADQLHAYQTHRSRSMESRNKVFNRYPVLQDKNSIHRKQFDAFIQENHQHPDYAAVFESPKWPELMASEFVARYQAAQPQQPQVPQVPQQQMQATPQYAPAMGTQAKVLTTGTAAQPAHTPMTAQGMLSTLPNVSSEDLYALLGNPGGPQPSA